MDHELYAILNPTAHSVSIPSVKTGVVSRPIQREHRLALTLHLPLVPGALQPPRLPRARRRTKAVPVQAQAGQPAQSHRWLPRVLCSKQAAAAEGWMGLRLAGRGAVGTEGAWRGARACGRGAPQGL